MNNKMNLSHRIHFVLVVVVCVCVCVCWGEALAFDVRFLLSALKKLT